MGDIAGVNSAEFKRTLLVLVVFNAVVVASVVGYFFFVYRDLSEQDGYVNGIYFFVGPGGANASAPSDGTASACRALSNLSWVRAAAGPSSGMVFNGTAPMASSDGSAVILVWTEWVEWDIGLASEARSAVSGAGLAADGPYRVRSDFEAPSQWSFLSGKAMNWRTYRVTQPDGGSYPSGWLAANYNLVGRVIQNATSATVLLANGGASAGGQGLLTFETTGSNQANFHVWGPDRSGYRPVVQEALDGLGQGFTVEPI